MEPQIETLDAKHCVGVRTPVRQQEIGERIGALLPAVMAVAGDAIAGPPFARWLEWDAAANSGLMELGVPVARPVAGRDDVAAGELSAGRAVVHWHVGPYDGLAKSWEFVRAWTTERGLVARGAPWEEYCSDCAVTPPAELRTRIVWPIE